MTAPAIRGRDVSTVSRLLERNRGTAHSGLIYDRWLAIWTDGEGAPDTVQLQEPLQKFVGDFDRCRYEPTNQEALDHYHSRLANATGPEYTESIDAQVLWRFASGLGAAHPTDNGFSFDHVIGVPCITGSATKGLCRQTAEILGADTDLIATLLGPKEGQGHACGDLIFFDALPLAWPRLAVDIVNCHHPAYYGALGNSSGRAKSPLYPSETEDPNPVFFLVVDRGSSFRFVITSRSGNKRNAERGADWVKQGLGLLGIGAKTAVGYGTMAEPESKDDRALEPARQTVWSGILLSYNKGSGEIRGDYEGQKAFASRSEAMSLIKELPAPASKKLQKKGLLKAKLTVELRGGKNWKILNIDPD